MFRSVQRLLLVIALEKCCYGELICFQINTSETLQRGPAQGVGKEGSPV